MHLISLDSYLINILLISFNLIAMKYDSVFNNNGKATYFNEINWLYIYGDDFTLLCTENIAVVFCKLHILLLNLIIIFLLQCYIEPKTNAENSL